MTVATPGLFLDADEMVELTGRKRKGLQIEQLKRLRIPFLVNARGRAKVARVVIEGRRDTESEQPKKWAPSVLGSR